MTQPVLYTERLVLRPFVDSDAARQARLAGTRRVHDTTGSIPFPYSEEQALGDIRRFSAEFAAGTSAHFAMALRESPEEMIGDMLLKSIEAANAQAELGFWIAEEWGGRGYVTEAAISALRYAFEEREMNRVCAFSMVRNTASARVLERLGFCREGVLRERVRKWGVFEDVDAWGLLRRTYFGGGGEVSNSRR